MITATKGLIVLLCGTIGLVLTIIWIVTEKLNKDKRESKVIKAAIYKTVGTPHQEGGTTDFLDGKTESIFENNDVESTLLTEEPQNTEMLQGIADTCTESLFNNESKNYEMEDESKTEAFYTESLR